MPLTALLKIEYQILDGGELDIDVHLASPEGRTLVFEQRKSDGIHTIETEDGDYMFCFDNTFSTTSEKVIFFELILDNMGIKVQGQEDWKKYITNTDVLEMKLDDILESINSIKSRLSKSGHIIKLCLEHLKLVIKTYHKATLIESISGLWLTSWSWWWCQLSKFVR